MIPFTTRRKHETKNQFTKRYTNLLYDALPQTSLEDRAKCTEIRDKLIEINQGLFGYIVTHKFLNNHYVSYEDKYQSCIARFCECWFQYKYEGEKNYRTDVSFSSFFIPRIGEMLERDFNEVKYSLQRTLYMKVGKQLGKYWSDITYEDLSDPRLKLSPKDMNSLLAVFGTFTRTSVDDIDFSLESEEEDYDSFIDNFENTYQDLVGLLINEMIEKERKLNYKDIKYLAEVFEIDPKELRSKIPIAEAQLFERLTKDVRDKDITFE